MSAKDTKTKFIWPEIGQDNLCLALEKTIVAGKLSQAYAFIGPEGIGKKEIALAFARNVIASSGGNVSDQMSASYSDLMTVAKEEDKKNISIEQVRDLIHRLNMSSFLGSYKVGIIEGAENLSLDAANALLKTLEEPREGCLIILTAVSLDKLPATIASRLAIWRILPAKREAVYDYLLSLGAKREAAREISSLALGRPGFAKRMWEDSSLLETELSPVKDLLGHLLGEKIISERELDNWLGKGGFSSESAAAVRLINLFKQALRDLALYDLGLEETVSFPRFRNDFSKLDNQLKSRKISIASYVAASVGGLNDALDGIEANVSARRALSAALAGLSI